MSEARPAKRARQPTQKVRQMYEEQVERTRRAEQPLPPSRREKAVARRLQQATAGSITSQPVRLVQRMVVPRAATGGTTPLVRPNINSNTRSTSSSQAAPRAPNAPAATSSRPAQTTHTERRAANMSHDILRTVTSSLPAESLFDDDTDVVDHVRGEPVYNLHGLDRSYDNLKPPEEQDLDFEEEQPLPQDEPEDEWDDQPRPPRRALATNHGDLGSDEDEEDEEPLALTRLNRGRKRTHADALADDVAAPNRRAVSEGPSPTDIDIDDRLPTLHKINPAAVGRGCLKDYDDESQLVIVTSQALYDIFCVIRTAYPDQNVQDKWGKECFAEACRRQEVQYRATPEVVRMTTRRGTHLRNRWMGHAREAIKVAYRFKGGNSQETKKKNIKLVQQLLVENSSGFVFPKAELRKPEAQRKGMYKHHAFAELLYRAAFKNTHSLGIVYEDVFDEHIGLPTFAFLCTMLELAIQEWAGGVWKMQGLDENQDIRLYNTHVENLERFERSFADNNLLVKMGKTLLSHVRHRAGAGPLHGDTHASAIPQSVFDSMRENWASADTTEADYEEPDDSSDEVEEDPRAAA